MNRYRATTTRTRRLWNQQQPMRIFYGCYRKLLKPYSKLFYQPDAIAPFGHVVIFGGKNDNHS